jgi:RNA polymerase sigma factor (sigma-70 family)
VQEINEEPEKEIQSEDELDLEDDLLQELENLIEVPAEDLVEVVSEEDLPHDLLDELGLFFHEVNLQPLLSRADEFRLFTLIQAERRLNEHLHRWGDLNQSVNVVNATLNIYQKTTETWDDLRELCAESKIQYPGLGDIFSEIFIQRIIHCSYNSESLAEWFDTLPPEGLLRERAGKLALEVTITTMLIPVEVIIWLSGHLARDECVFPELSHLANWIINIHDIKFDTQKLLEYSRQAHDSMVLSNMRLVVWMAKRYQGRGVELADLVQVGTIGLLKAIEKFDPVRGYKFSTYATWWVRQAITRYIADNSRLIRFPAHFHDMVGHVLKIRDNLVQKLHRRPTSEEIAYEDPRLTAEKVQSILLISREPLSLDMKAGNDDEDSVLGDFIPDDHPELVWTVEHKILQEVLDSVFDCLPARERKVLALRYGLDGNNPITLEEVGEKMGVTRERIRQIESNALSRLRHPKIRKLLREFL